MQTMHYVLGIKYRLGYETRTELLSYVKPQVLICRRPTWVDHGAAYLNIIANT